LGGDNLDVQSEINIGLVGHVDHGKTTLTKALSGVWTDRHSEEIKRGISIRLGYADCEFYRCPNCGEPECYSTKPICPNCGEKTKFLRKISFVDSPGHETLMATMLSGAAIMDGAVLVIAANEDCPQPQTAEHLIALNILGISNVVVAQNKVDLVSKEKAMENYRQIRKFIQNSVVKDAPIIPIAAHYGANVDALIQAMEKAIPTPSRDMKKTPRMSVARSFDVNNPGTPIEKLRGGVLGGSLIQGKLKVGEEIEIRPGVKRKGTYEVIRTTIVSLVAGSVKLEEARPGGLIAVGTQLDPSLTKSDNLAGSVICLPEDKIPVWEELTLEIHLLKELIGTKEKGEVKPVVKSEPLMLSVGSAVTVGIVTNPKRGEMKLKRPVCAEIGSKVAISRMFGTRWHLVGYGTIK